MIWMRRTNVLKGVSSIAMGYPGKCWSYPLWKCSRNDWTWHLVLCWSWYSEVQSKSGVGDLGGLFQPLNDFMILCPDSLDEFYRAAKNKSVEIQEKKSICSHCKYQTSTSGIVFWIFQCLMHSFLWAVQRNIITLHYQWGSS